MVVGMAKGRTVATGGGTVFRVGAGLAAVAEAAAAASSGRATCAWFCWPYRGEAAPGYELIKDLEGQFGGCLCAQPRSVYPR